MVYVLPPARELADAILAKLERLEYAQKTAANERRAYKKADPLPCGGEGTAFDDTDFAP